MLSLTCGPRPSFVLRTQLGKGAGKASNSIYRQSLARPELDVAIWTFLPPPTVPNEYHDPSGVWMRLGSAKDCDIIGCGGLISPQPLISRLARSETWLPGLVTVYVHAWVSRGWYERYGAAVVMRARVPHPVSRTFRRVTETHQRRSSEGWSISKKGKPLKANTRTGVNLEEDQLLANVDIAQSKQSEPCTVHFVVTLNLPSTLYINVRLALKLN